MAKARKKRTPSTSRTRKRRPSRRSTSRSKPRRSTKKATPSFLQRIGWDLTAERKRELIGVVFIGLGLFTFLGAFLTSEGSLTRSWVQLLRVVFGEGSYILPFVFLAVGIWPLLAHLGERRPQLDVEQLIGLGLLFLAVLAILHAFTGVTSLEQALILGREGQGGGIIGAAINSALLGGLGGAGTAVTYLAWLLVSITFALGVSLSEMMGLFVGVLGSVRERVGAVWTGRERSSRTSELPLVETASMESQKETAPPRRSASADETAVSAADAELSQDWVLPDLTMVLEVGAEGKADDEFDRKRAQLIEETLALFGAPAHVVEINRGPTITQFGVEPDFLETRGGRRTKVKVSKVAALADDLALALAAPSIRIEAPVPGKGYIGIEVPNPQISLVALRNVMETEGFRRIKSNLGLGLGQDVSGKAVAADLSAMPHLLIAGTTGSGKSVCVNSIITCLLLQNSPEVLRFVMIDPKRVELTNYNGVPHLMAPVVVELDRVVSALQWVSREMDERYTRFSKVGVRNITDYNERMRLTDQKIMPFIIVVIDELADLMMMAPDETERVVTRLAQLARATGIHLVIATQRPSVDVVTGLIKANFPARIAFAVASSVDSRVIIDQPGAERLLGRGDMLFQAPDAAAPIRMQGSFVSEPELSRLIRYWKNAALGGEATHPSRPSPVEHIPSGAPLKQAPLWDEGAPLDEDRDELFGEAVTVLREMRRASISLLQRRLRIGYTRAARLIDQLEAAGIVGPAKSGSQAREVLDYGELAGADEG